MITLHLTRSDDYEGVYLPLPATPAEIGEAWAYLDHISDDVASEQCGTSDGIRYVHGIVTPECFLRF